MRTHLLTTFAIVLTGNLICSKSSAQETPARSAHIDVEIEFWHLKDGKKSGSVTHPKNTKDLADFPLTQSITGLDGRSFAVTISYVGYANFQTAGKAKTGQLGPGRVFAVQVLTGEKGVTIKTARDNTTKLVIYRESPQTIFENEALSVTLRNKK